MVTSPKAFSILIAEDDEDDYLLTLEALKAAGVKNEVQWVKDGEELIEVLNLHYNNPEGPDTPCKPGMILLDLNMPKKDGREVLEEIKGNSHFRKIPVIIMTTSKADTDIAHSYELGVNSFIQKPVRFNEFVDVIKVMSHYWFETVKLPL